LSSAALGHEFTSIHAIRLSDSNPDATWKVILRKAKGIPLDRLTEVGSLYETKIDSELRKRIKNEYPQLLQK
jgi:hypothetical protein